MRHPVYRRGLRHGVGAAIEHEEALQALGAGSVIDVGANKGQFALLARALYPHAPVHAFEPLEPPRRQFQRLFSGDPLTTLHPLALGETSGEATIYISGREDSSSLLPITDRQASLFPGTGAVGTTSIAVVRGDDVIDPSALPRPLLIKLDVQGYELAALKGMPTLLASADFVYLEISYVELYGGQPLAQEVTAFLERAGYRLTGIYNPSQAPDGTRIQADGLFTRARF